LKRDEYSASVGHTIRSEDSEDSPERRDELAEFFLPLLRALALVAPAGRSRRAEVARLGVFFSPVASWLATCFLGVALVAL
jgi:hypothetical protein